MPTAILFGQSASRDDIVVGDVQKAPVKTGMK
jgi:hypothetical protein